MDEEKLTGGFVNEVVRIGDCVHRTAGPWTPTVHALLRHLEVQGFDEAPRVRGMDDSGREILSFIPGETIPWIGWPTHMLEIDGIVKLGALVRRYHDAVQGFTPPPSAQWRNPLAHKDGEVIRHGDFSPFNTIWQGSRLVGLIDWDFAQPGSRISDVAYLAWYAVPLQNEGRAREYGFERQPDRAKRLDALREATGYDYTSNEIIDAAIENIVTELDHTQRLAAEGIHPWSLFARDGAIQAFEGEAAWIQDHRHSLT